MINQTIASTAVNQTGLDALGLASGQLAAQWAEATPTYDAAAMTLSLPNPSRWRAMIGGVLQWHAFGASALTDASGSALTGVVGVFRFHPQAALRIQRLIGSRYDGRTDGRASRPVPVWAAIRDGDPPAETADMVETDPPLAPVNGAVGAPLSFGTLTFHDELGLIIDPVAVASLFRDLMRALPALRNDDAGPASDLNTPGASAGGIGSIASLATGRRVHFVDIFQGPWQDRSSAAGIRIGTGSRLGTGPHDWPDSTNISISGTAGDIRFGFSPEGTLATTALTPPAFPATVVPTGAPAPSLDREFFRIVIADLGLHLKGNRTDSSIDGISGADDDTVLEPAPLVRDGSDISLLVDGQATLGAVTEILNRSGFDLAVSPTIATDVAFPTTRADRWPARPATTETPQSLDADRSERARTEATASYVGTGPDVILTWPAGALPAEAHVRAFPRVDPGPAIVPLSELDFARRGDGAAGVASTTGLTLLLKDPYRVGTGSPPNNPKLRFDLVIVTRDGTVNARLIGGLEVDVATGGTAPTPPTVTNLLDTVPLNQRGIAPAPILGIPPTSPAAGSDPVLAALGESAPREAPRFRTMARMETIVASDDTASPGTWQGVLTSGFLDGRSMRDDARLGNPGNPGGPEDHAPGVFVSGPLATDLARYALRRTHHLSTRLAELDNGRWNNPAAGTDTFAGAVLRNVAATVEAPELEVLPESLVHSLPTDWAGLISAIQALLPASMSSLIGAIPTPGAGDRWADEVRRETFAVKHGRRDSQWSWRWAIGHAQKLIYLETPLFGATADGSADHEVNLIAELRSRLQTVPDLRVIIATPKRIPFGPGYESIAQYFHQARNEAFATLQLAAPKRVIIFHPMGFPGRPEVSHGTVGIVDDVWMLLGSSAFARRGLTFDSSLDAVFIDKTITRGVSSGIRDFRRRIMARLLGLTPPAAGETPNANWVRLAQQTSAFELIREIVGRGGDGLLEPLWQGLPLSELPALDRAIADPEGRNFSAVLGLFTAFLAELGQDRV